MNFDALSRIAWDTAKAINTHSDPEGIDMVVALDDRPINILIVDDEPKNLTVLETILENPAYRLVRAGSADEALLALVVEEFALLILDIRMPGMSGFELATMIKDRKKTAEVPIIFLTAFYNEDQHVLTGYDTGAVDYLHKPVNAPILRSKVAVFAELFRKNRECELANKALLAEVTERRRAEEDLRELNDSLECRVIERTDALRDSELRYRRLFETAQDGVLILNFGNGKIVDVNPFMSELLGYTYKQFIGMDLWKLGLFNEETANQTAIRELQEKGYKRYDRLPLLSKNGQQFDVEVVANVYGVNDQNVIQCNIRDVTLRTRLEKQLQEQAAHVTELNRRKDEFLAMLSHELRSPLAPISNALQLLQMQQEKETELQHQARCIIERQTGQLQHL
ncbi:MAG TPA: response regulator, partial [Pirellula sp.]|nr:response regulator [Pirellula sp.]